MSARIIQVVEDLNGNMFGDQARTGVAPAAAGFPANATPLDDFNRANENPLSQGGNWAGPIQDTAGILRVVSNEALVNDLIVSDPGGGYYQTTFNANQEAYCKMTILHQYVQVWGRINTPGSGVTGYCVQARMDTQDIRFYRWDNAGSPNQLGSIISMTVASGDSMGLTLTGGTLEGWYKVGAGAWASLGTRSDSTYTGTGKIGMQMNSGSACDDFGGGNI